MVSLKLKNCKKISKEKSVLLSFLRILETFILLFLITGCGNQTSDSGLGYQNNRQVISDNKIIISTCIIEDTLFYATSEVIQDDDNQNSEIIKLYKKEINEDASVEIPIKISNDESLYRMCATSHSIWILVSSEKNETVVRDNLEKNREPNQLYILKEFDFQGNLIQETQEISQQLQENNEQIILSFEADLEGRLCLIGSSGSIYCMDENGTWEGTIHTTGTILTDRYYKKGEILITQSIMNETSVKKIDIKNRQLVDIDNKDVYYATEEYGLIRYEKGGKIKNNIISWLDNGIFPSQIQEVEILEEDKMLVITCDFADAFDTLSQNLISQTESSEDLSRTVITYGVASDLSESVKLSVVHFNQQNKNFKIEVVNYLEDGQSEEATTKLNAAIAAGTGPDIINVSDFDYQTYAAKGVLIDLTSYMNNDLEFHMEDYFENILKCYTYQDQIIALPREFQIETLVGSKKNFSKEGWTLQELYQYMDQHPEFDTLYETGPQSMLMSLMTCYMDHFYNLDTGTCNFDSQEFVDLLEFCKKYAYKEGEPQDNIKAGNQLLMKVNNLNYINYQMFQQIFEGDIIFVGYPQDDGIGAWISTTNTSMGIASYSENKEGAWEFIKFSLSKEEQTNLSSLLYQVRKDSFQELMEYQMEKKANIVEDDKGNLVEEPYSTYNFGYTRGNEYIYYAPTQEMINQITNIVQQANTIVDLDMNVWNIIVEEDIYLKGDGDPWKMAKNIQNRVTLYVEESR